MFAPNPDENIVLTKRSIYICSFVNSLQQQITTNLGVYVTSSFMLHSLYSTTSVLSSVIGGVSKFPIAKIIDIWGRVEGFILMTFLCTIGLIMMAACKNVETYAAAQVRRPPHLETTNSTLTALRSSTGSATTAWATLSTSSWPT